MAGIQVAPEVIDVGLIERPELLAFEGQLAADDAGWAQARVGQEQSGGGADGEGNRQPEKWPHREPVVLPRSPGHVCRHAQRRYRDDHAADSDDSVRVHLNLPTR